jgi:hypothetical protein
LQKLQVALRSPTVTDSGRLTSLKIALDRLDLRPRERLVLRNCLWALTQVPDGHFLTPPNTMSSAERLIARGYLTKVSDPSPVTAENRGWGWLVCMTAANSDKIMTDANRIDWRLKGESNDEAKGR